MKNNNKRNQNRLQVYNEYDELSGIYMIKCSQNNKVYIGESKNIYRRWNWHIDDLMNRKHYNQSLQYDYNKYGLKCFEFKILQIPNYDDLDYHDAKFMNYVYENIYIGIYKQEYELYNIENSLYSNMFTDRYKQSAIKHGSDEESIDEYIREYRKSILNILTNYYFEYDKEGLHHHRMVKYDDIIKAKIKEAEFYKQNITASQIINYFTKAPIQPFMLVKTVSYLKGNEICSVDIKYVKKENKEILLGFFSKHINYIIDYNNKRMNTELDSISVDVNLEGELLSNDKVMNEIQDIVNNGQYNELDSISLFQLFCKIKLDNKDIIKKNYTYSDFKDLLLNNNILMIDTNGKYAPTDKLVMQDYISYVGPSGGIYLTQEGGVFLEQFFKDTYNNKKEVQNIGEE